MKYMPYIIFSIQMEINSVWKWGTSTALKLELTVLENKLYSYCRRMAQTTRKHCLLFMYDKKQTVTVLAQTPGHLCTQWQPCSQFKNVNHFKVFVNSKTLNFWGISFLIEMWHSLVTFIPNSNDAPSKRMLFTSVPVYCKTLNISGVTFLIWM